MTSTGETTHESYGMEHYIWRVPAKSSGQFRGSDYSAAIWERRGEKPTIVFGWSQDTGTEQ